MTDTKNDSGAATTPAKFTAGPCEEVCGMIGDTYLRCGADGSYLIGLRGRTEGPYRLCLIHASHYVHNRNCFVIDAAPGAPKL